MKGDLNNTKLVNKNCFDHLNKSQLMSLYRELLAGNFSYNKFSLLYNIDTMSYSRSELLRMCKEAIQNRIVEEKIFISYKDIEKAIEKDFLYSVFKDYLSITEISSCYNYNEILTYSPFSMFTL